MKKENEPETQTGEGVKRRGEGQATRWGKRARYGKDNSLPCKGKANNGRAITGQGRPGEIQSERREQGPNVKTKVVKKKECKKKGNIQKEAKQNCKGGKNDDH